MKKDKKEGLKNMLENFINEKINKMQFEDEIGEIDEFKDLSDVEEEVHKLELDLDEIEEHVKEVAEDIKLIDETLKITCNVKGVERLLMDGVNCNIKPIVLLNVALITPLNLRIIDLTINDCMESIMDIKAYLLAYVGKNESIYVRTDIRTLYNLGLLTAVDSLFSNVELNAIEFRGITAQAANEEIEQLIKFSVNIE
jgi:hypothetical protein